MGSLTRAGDRTDTTPGVLSGMSEQAAIIRGTLTIDSEARRGTRVNTGWTHRKDKYAGESVAQGPRGRSSRIRPTSGA